MGLFSRFFRRRAPVPDFAALLSDALVPAVQLRVTDASPGAPFPRSWFGGTPHAPEGLEWPWNEGRPLAFVAQLDLSEVATAHRFDWLPPEGTLLFFYDLVGMERGFDPDDPGGWRVFHAEPGASLFAGAPPPALDPEQRFEPRGVACVPLRRPAGSIGRAGIAPPEQTDEVSRLVRALESHIDDLFDQAPHHQVGGLPDPVQFEDDEMEIGCQGATGIK